MKLLQSTKIFRATWFVLVLSGVCISAFPSQADAQSDSELKILKVVPKDADFRTRLVGPSQHRTFKNAVVTDPLVKLDVKNPPADKFVFKH